MNHATHPENLVVAVFVDPNKAHAVVEQLIGHDFPMDQLSILHRASSSGDDVLGLAYRSGKERIKVWGEHGAVWGALGGVLVGLGLLVVPGVGPLLAAGPIAEAIVGAAAGAGIGAGAAAVTRVATALNRTGIAQDKLDELHQALMDGKTLLLLHCGNTDPQVWVQRLSWDGAEPVLALP